MGLVLITGAGGLLGREVARVASERGIDVQAHTHASLDIGDESAVMSCIEAARPAVVINCAAMTDVDACEADVDSAQAANALGPGSLARGAASVGAEVVHISTDVVFDGEKGEPYVETDAPNPLSMYGRTKLDGERAVREANDRSYIVRPAWVFGPEGRNYISHVPDLLATGETIRCVGDQWSSPTYAPDLADALLALVGSGAYGTFHVTNGGRASRVDFCRRAVDVAGLSIEVESVAWEQLPNAARRPRDTSMSNLAWADAGFPLLRPWEEAVDAFVARAAVR